MTGGVEVSEDLDAAAAGVPSYPVVRLTIETIPSVLKSQPPEDEPDDDGWVQGLVDGQTVFAGTRTEVIAHLVSRAAHVAAGRPCGAVRAILSGFEDGPQAEPHVVAVTIDGVLLPLDKSPQRQRGARASRRQLLSLMGIAALSAGAVGGLSWAATRRVGSAASVGVSAPLLARARVQLPVAPPAGYSRVALWSVPMPLGSALVGSRTPGTAEVATGGGLVWVPSADRKVVQAVDVATGRVRWSRAVGDTFTGGPVVVVIGGRRRMVVWTSSQVVVLAALTGEVCARWALPTVGMLVVAVGGGAGSGVVAMGPGQHLQVLTGSGWISRVLPAGAAVVGVTASLGTTGTTSTTSSSAEGMVLAAGGGRVWVVSSASVAGEGTPLPSPAGSVWSGPVAVVDDVLVAAFTPQRTRTLAGGAAGRVVLRAFRAGVASAGEGSGSGSWVPVWTSPVVPVSSAGGVGGVGSQGSGVVTGAVAVAPDGDWGIYGSSVLDLRTGGVHRLPGDWVTSCVGPGGAFGTTEGSVVTVGPDGRLRSGTPRAGGTLASAVPPVPPVAVVAWPPSHPAGSGPVHPSGGVGVALVVAQDGPATSLYAVPALDVVPALAADTGGGGGR